MNTARSTRRVFLGTALAAGLAPRWTPSLRAEAGAQKGGPYIDIHTHLGRTWTHDPP